MLWRDDCKAPFVKESRIQYSLQLADIISIPHYGTFLVIGHLQNIYLSENFINADGFIPLEKYETITSLGLNSYYGTSLLKQLPNT